LGDSIFCTWTQYPRCITQNKIIDMARQIRDQGYPSSVLTIDDRWESGFGELQFSSDFPNPAGMVTELHKLGFQVLLWVTPFVNIGTANYDMLGEKGWLVPRKDGNGPATFTWWGGDAGLIDLTNPDGHAWFKAQLLRLRDDVGIDGFKIDGGDAKYHPDPAESAWYDCPGPSGYSDILLSLFEEIAPGMCETRTAWLSQRRNILWREGGKDSHWGIENGLTALVTLGLNLSVMGYDMLMPDMVPGRVQTMISNMPLPTDEFFVRWTEASAFFPLLQFSYFPWNYKGDAAVSALEYAKIHKALEGYLLSITTNRTEPIMRPLWWAAPESIECYSCGDQWLLGPDLLVAPVLAPHQLTRDIILPGGTWIDVWTGKAYSDSLIISHPAPCPGIPLFVRASNKELLNTLQEAVKYVPYGKVKPGITTTTWESGLDRDIKVTG
jgi:alpha-glucosidase (family GH31 glycosyl hydrolase)